MEHLWSPWRSHYIGSFAVEESKPKGCFLCEASNATTDPESASLVVHRGENCFVIMNRYPYNAGHVMVVPNEHCGDFSSLHEQTAQELMRLLQLSHKVLTRLYAPHGFNVGANFGRVAGAGVPDHLHMHMLPRWNGDTNFMPLIAETKVVSESLEQTAEDLRRLFREMAG